MEVQYTNWKYLSESYFNSKDKKYLITIKPTFNYKKLKTISKMPRRQPLSAITPNRFYQIDATLKFKHVGPTMITGIIEQDQVQTKICIPKDGIQLEEGKHYVFGKCFNSSNGWLYAKQPSETIVEKDEIQPKENFLTLKEIFEQRDQFANHYVSTQLKVVSIEPKQTVVKNEQNLILYNMKCFSDSLLINVEIWNQEIQAEDVRNKVLNFIGFKIKSMSHKTITLVSTVYSKIKKLSRLPFNRERFIYDPTVLYKNVSSFYEIRTVEQVAKACQEIHKNYSICQASVNSIEALSYEGCAKCKKKLHQNGCFQCGSNVIKQNFQYLKVIIEDATGMIECAVFDEMTQKAAKQLEERSKAYFYVKSSAKKNYETGEFFVSHVVAGIKNMANSQ